MIYNLSIRERMLWEIYHQAFHLIDNGSILIEDYPELTKAIEDFELAYPEFMHGKYLNEI